MVNRSSCYPTLQGKMGIIVRRTKVIFFHIVGELKKIVSPLKALGSRIRVLRKCLGWSQEELAYKSGLDRSYVGGIERGERNITFLTLCQVARTLKKDVAALTGGLP